MTQSKPFCWDTESAATVAHYVRMVRAHGMPEVWREQCRKLEREHEVFAGLEAKVREKLKEPA